MSEKKKSPKSLGIFLGFLLSFAFGVQVIAQLITNGVDGLPSALMAAVLCGLSVLFLLSCFKERKEYFAEQKAAKQISKNDAALKEALKSEGATGLVECTYLGGSGYGFSPSEKFVLAPSNDVLRLVKNSSKQEVQLSFNQIHEVEVSGPGTVTTNAGVSGGGFGLEGFLKGAVTAAVINAATTKSSTNTFARILTTEGEIYLHTAAIEPAALKIMLSPVFVSIANRSRKPNENAQATVAQEIEKLHKLKQDGLLDEAEFKAAKNKLLGL